MLLSLEKGVKYCLSILIILHFLFIPKWLISDIQWVKHPITSVTLLILSLLLIRTKQLRLLHHPITYTLGAFALLNIGSFFWAVHPALTWTNSSIWVTLFLLFLTLSSLPFSHIDERFLKSLCLLIIGVNVAHVYLAITISLYQNNWVFDNFVFQDIFRQDGMNTNYLSAILLMYIPVLKYYHSQRLYPRIALTLIILILLFVPILNSRATTLALLCYGLYIAFGLIKTKQIRSLLRLAGIILIGSSIFLYAFIDDKEQFLNKYNPMRTITQNTGDDRIQIWENSLKLGLERPFLGHGAGNWKTEVYKYGYDDYTRGRVYTHAHNVWVETFSELGFVGLILMLGFFGILFFRNSENQVNNDLIKGLTLIFIILTCFYGFYQPKPISISPFWILLVAVTALNFGKSQIRVEKGYFYSSLVVTLSLLSIALAIAIPYSHRTYKALVAAKHQRGIVSALSQTDAIKHSWFNGFFKNEAIEMREGLRLWKIGRKQQAIQKLEQAVEIVPYDRKAWMHLGKMQTHLKHYKAASISFTNALQLYSLDATASLSLTELGVKLNDSELFEQGMRMYHNQIYPMFLSKYSDASLLDNNPNVRKYWLKSCSQIDQWQDQMMQWGKKQIELSNAKHN